MSREFQTHYFQDEATFQQAFAAFNALSSWYDEWRSTRARKVHTDLFGETIKSGEIYYKRQCGAAWDAVIKVSQSSMERLVYALLAGNPQLMALGEQHAANRLRELQADYAQDGPSKSIVPGLEQ